MKPLIDEIRSRIDVLNTMLDEYGRSDIFNGSRPKALFVEERMVLINTLEKLESIYERWGKSNYKEGKNCDG